MMRRWETALRNFGRLAVASAVLLISATPGLTATSVYTDLPFENNNCKPVGPVAAEDEPEGASVSMVCPGYKSYDVYYKDGDGRISIHYGSLSQDIIDTAWESFGPFNSVSEKIEWRLDESGKPFAAIHRYTIANFNPDTGMAEDALRGQVLVISRVGQPEDKSGCFVGLVDALANKDANELARKVADDLAPGFRCKTDTAVYHGARGPNSPDFTAYFGD